MEKFLYEIEEITKKLKELGYSEEQIVSILGMYINARNSGIY